MTVKRKLKLKRKYKNILIYCLGITAGTLVFFGALAIYQNRIDKVGNQKAGSIVLFK